ncbi:hypothetical protein [Xanthomonas graminis]|nr:hypothetical protein [Xanthomonas translucens]UKE78600.1 hypothetical protein KM317_05055 [Xanthomonas translucens pv. arrhenatheri]
MPDHSIEARLLCIAGIAGHAYWVLRDERGNALAELHGLATDRHTGTPIPIGTDARRHALRAWHYPHDADYANANANAIGAPPDRTSYLRDGQPARTAASGDKHEILARWHAALRAMPELNAQDLDYPNYGFKLFGATINSNSAFRTFGELMGVVSPAGCNRASATACCRASASRRCVIASGRCMTGSAPVHRAARPSAETQATTPCRDKSAAFKATQPKTDSWRLPIGAMALRLIWGLPLRRPRHLAQHHVHLFREQFHAHRQLARTHLRGGLAFFGHAAWLCQPCEELDELAQPHQPELALFGQEIARHFKIVRSVLRHRRLSFHEVAVRRHGGREVGRLETAYSRRVYSPCGCCIHRPPDAERRVGCTYEACRHKKPTGLSEVGTAVRGVSRLLGESMLRKLFEVNCQALLAQAPRHWHALTHLAK